jgi:predicted nucleotidyltransferase
MKDMNPETPLDADSLGRIEELCRRYKVRRLELFGSAARRDVETPPGDLDFLVDFEDLQPGEHAECYFGLLFELQRLFQTSVDLVVTSAIGNRYFLQAIEADRRVLYAA